MIWGSWCQSSEKVKEDGSKLLTASRNITLGHESVKKQTKSVIKVQEYIAPDSKITSITGRNLMSSTMPTVDLLIFQILMTIRATEKKCHRWNTG